MYGRARRIALARTIAIVLGAILILYLVITRLFTTYEYKEYNSNFEYLRDYFVGQGYSCKSIDQNGGICTMKKIILNIIL